MAREGQSDRNLLLGILALQMDFLSRDTLISGMNAWVLDKARGLGPILVDRGALSPARRELLEAMVREHVSAHGGDAAQSLTSVIPPADYIDALRQLCDPDIDSTIARSAGDSRGAEPGAEGTRDSGSSSPEGSRYQVLRPLARGGIGTVSVALDTELRREVALKEIQVEHADEPHSRARFLIEAEVTGRLEHPGIVPVYGLGTDPDGRPYYAMRLVKGDSLREAIRRYYKEESGPDERAMGLRKLLSRFLDVCNAVAFAHSRGVIHRDIKPSNILLGPYGETLLVDWGLAKVIGRPEPAASAEATLRPELSSGSGETMPGSAIGTPAYMSPEQAEGKLERIGPASDVYSLGATLFTLLTGAPPIDDQDVASILQRVIRGEIRSPRQVNPRTDRAIEAVCLKAMAREPDDRYASARDLAEDLERWLADEPVSAYRDPLATRMTRWGRRHKTAAVGLGVLLVTASAALTASNLAIQGVQRETAAQRDIAKQRSQEATEAATTLERQLYFNRVNLAQREWALNNVALADQLLGQCPEHLRGWEWSYCKWLCHMDRLTITAPPDDPAAAEWSLRGVCGLAFSPDGRQVASGGADFAATIWSTTTGKPLRTLRGHRDVVLSVAYSPDGRTIATGSKDSTIKLWDAETGRELHTLTGTIAWIWSLAFNPEGTRIAAISSAFLGAKTPEVRIWDVATGRLVRGWRAPSPGFRSVAWSPDGARIVAAGATSVAIMDPATGSQQKALTGHAEGAYGVAYSPDGRWIATAGLDRQIILWDAATGRLVRSLRGHGGRVLSVAFHPDSRLIASAGNDNTLRVWDVDSGRELATVRGHTQSLTAVRFSRDGSQLASASEDGTVKLWESSTVAEGESRSLEGRQGWASRVQYSADGMRLASAWYAIVKLWDVASGRELRQISVEGLSGVAISPDGRTLATCGQRGLAIQLWEVATGKATLTFHGHGVPAALAFRPDGTQLVSGGEDGFLRFWDVADGREIRALKAHDGGAFSVSYSPDGRTIASIGWDSTVRTWDAADGRALRTLSGITQVRSDRCGNALAFSPDGRNLAAASDDGTVAVWDLADGRRLLTLRGHTEQVNAVAYLDARRIVSAAEDSTIRLWDAGTGDNVFTLRGHLDGVLGLACRPDGKQIASASIDETVRLWDVSAPTPEAIRQRRQDALRRDAERAVEDHRWAEAISTLGSLIEAEPTSASYLILRARAFASAGRAADGLADLDRASELGTNDEWAWIEVGRTLSRENRLDRAETILRRVATRDRERSMPNNTGTAHALDALGSAFQRRGDAEGALRAFSLAAEVFEAYFRGHADHAGSGRVWVPHLHDVIASILVEAGRRDEAARHFDRALEVLSEMLREFPTDAGLRGRLASCHRSLGRLNYRKAPALALDHLRLAAAAFEDLPQPNPFDLHHLAGCYAMCSALVARGRSGPTPAEAAERENLAGRAVEAVRRSITAGYDNASHLRQCVDLAPISHRADFLALVLDIGFPPDPFARDPAPPSPRQ